MNEHPGGGARLPSGHDPTKLISNTSGKLTFYATKLSESIESSLIDWEDRKLERALGRLLSALQDTPALSEVTW